MIKDIALSIVLSILLAVCLVGCLNLVGCVNQANNPKNVAPVAIEQGIINYGNGVYYFDYVGAEFGNALATFIRQHPDYQVITVTMDGSYGYGKTAGYFVVVKEK
jgi:hypothetical protein